MSYSNKISTTLHDVAPTPLIDQQEFLLAIPLVKKSYEALQSYLPLNSIDDNQCTMRNAQRLARTMVFFPLLIGILITFHYCINSLIELKSRSEVNILRTVNNVREKYGEDFYLRKALPKITEGSRFIGNDKTISFWKYLYYRYNYFHASTKFLIIDFLQFSSLLVFSLYLIHRCFFWKLQAPIFIDRQRQYLLTGSANCFLAGTKAKFMQRVIHKWVSPIRPTR
ncbi:hypothetical protein ID856_18755 [Xenorhabdus sp. 18]|uniref:hypothetical protein n=1 Tax=Xenorhabdus doucetiae TaxID=351671 RepID=UPI0019A54D86|nr:hypothetical protein [Xenorhabdus sp. 18]MBD2798507.1 hypothetical protein [Xenorhabdus sp. 18]